MQITAVVFTAVDWIVESMGSLQPLDPSVFPDGAWHTDLLAAWSRFILRFSTITRHHDIKDM
jgi:hypothetical protein